MKAIILLSFFAMVLSVYTEQYVLGALSFISFTVSLIRANVKTN